MLVLDLPGHGRNRLAPGEEPATVLEQDAAVGAVLEWLSEPAVLIGNSLGGALSLHAAATHPERVAAVVGLSPAGAPLAGEARSQVVGRLEQVERRQGGADDRRRQAVREEIGAGALAE